MSDLSCKLLVIGAGPGGYVCGIRAGQLGIDTVVVDPQAPGGTCLNVGCIPSKALIHAADEFYNIAHAPTGPLGISVAAPSIDLARTVEWKDGIVKRLNSGVTGLLKKAGTKLVKGQAEFIDGKTVKVTDGGETRRIRAEYIVIATGSAPVELPFLPFGGPILSSTDALALTELPARLAVVGGGYIGLEIGTAFAKLGTEVTVIEAEERILSQYDAALTRPVLARLKDLGVTVKTGVKAQGYENGALLTDDGEIPADKVLVTVGRRPRTGGIRIEELSLTMNGPFIKINAACHTSMRGVYAIGDVTGEPMLAHRAMAQGEMVAEHVAGRNVSWDRLAMPAVCFTDPEIVTCGALPGAEGTKASEFPFQANGRAMTTTREDGFVRVVWREADKAVLGIQAVGAGISELSAAFSLAIEMGATLDDIAATIHAHPTQSEGLQEAALRGLGHALHI
ncbi:dihydrolipoyl dehydrogenase [Paracoccus sp. SCSIO 75233]|uniref:dihydrolipoyl dehydrogenase n=1 Tax=Paracoccus sp. SCSIO 75233 TaxID=3017782 RepID=UPI0022F0D1C4|nr:dihydrolipoyl dehydrogenase [Paracoccus sp. SCSIO 75233]WBU52358.1 dihydrolipoyl dehydrogenase [Paracoccus sp. SCSIO 75233]